MKQKKKKKLTFVSKTYLICVSHVFAIVNQQSDFRAAFFFHLTFFTWQKLETNHIT